MKKTLIMSAFIASCMLLLGGCEKEDSSRCPQLVNFTIACYEQIVGREPGNDVVSGWRTSCDSNPHSDACLNCAMEQSCDDYLLNTDYVYSTLCADRCH